MTNSINPGEWCIAEKDILINGEVAFAAGERMIIERIEPHPEKPEYRHVVFSSRLQRRFQLSDTDITSVPQSDTDITSVPQYEQLQGVAAPTVIGSGQAREEEAYPADSIQPPPGSREQVAVTAPSFRPAPTDHNGRSFAETAREHLKIVVVIAAGLVALASVVLVLLLFTGDDTGKAKEYMKAGERILLDLDYERGEWFEKSNELEWPAPSSPFSWQQNAEMSEQRANELSEKIPAWKKELDDAKAEFKKILGLSGVKEYKEYAELQIELIDYQSKMFDIDLKHQAEEVNYDKQLAAIPEITMAMDSATFDSLNRQTDAIFKQTEEMWNRQIAEQEPLYKKAAEITKKLEELKIEKDL